MLVFGKVFSIINFDFISELNTVLKPSCSNYIDIKTGCNRCK